MTPTRLFSTREPKPTTVMRDALLNVMGSVLPLVITLATIPPYLRIIGDTRFGILAIVWAFLGYFALFEMGLGRATAKYIAELGAVAQSARESVFWTAAVVNLLLGGVGGLLGWSVAKITMPYWLKTNVGIQSEVVHALPWLAAAVPVATLTSVLMSALEGRQRFDVTNAQQLFSTALFQIAPLAIAKLYGPRVDWLVGTAVLARLIWIIPMLLCCIRFVPLRLRPRIDRKWMVRLFSYGAWLTVSGIIWPILVSLDRFVIGFVRGPQALTYYSIPYNFATKLAIIPASLAGALFPRFSAEGSNTATTQTAQRAVLAVGSLLTPIVVLGLLAAGPFFRLWIGVEAASRCTRAGELMLLGAWFNGLAYIPRTLLQARGRPDIVAKFHMAELVPFLGMLWVGIHFGGVSGAAAVWGLRASIDCGLLLIAGGIFRASFLRLVPSAALLAMSFSASSLGADRLQLRSAIAAVIFLVSLFVAHFTSPGLAGRIASLIHNLRGTRSPAMATSRIEQ